MPDPAGLAFKAYEIEELADIYFFRPCGMVLARLARALGLTPTAVTGIGALAGVAGGTLLHDDRFGMAAFGFIILHGILDSSDGQLARMTGQTSEYGRILDGVGGYLTHAAIYLGILAGALGRGADGSLVAIALAAAAANIVQAQMYDYHRTAYARLVLEGSGVVESLRDGRPFLLRAYQAAQRALSGLHPHVEAEMARRSIGGVVRDGDRARYRSCFYWPVRGWNLMGDNTRFYAIGVLAWLHRLDAFFLFLLVPMNVACVALWWWQARADRRFLAGL